MRYQLHNHLGSAALELDAVAEVISYEEYHPYGTTAFQARNTGIKAAAKRYRYTGMERDEESGLEYHSARYYLPWLGRWGSGDPIGIGGGINVFIYCRCNPILLSDKLGLDYEWCFTPGCGDFSPFEYTGEVAIGAFDTAKNTVKDTITRVIDLNTQLTAVSVKGLTGGKIILPYTKLSPESRRYDENLSVRENIKKTGVETKEGINALAKGIATGQPREIGALGFIVATSVIGKPPSLPNLPFIPAPQLATSVTTTGVAITEIALRSTAISTSSIAKFSGPIFAVAATSTTDSAPSARSGGKGYSDKYLRQKFRDDQAKSLKQLDKNDPIRKALLDEKTGRVRSGRGLWGKRGFEAGHVDARSSGLPQRFFLQDADFNALGGQMIESKGAFSSFTGIEVRPGVYLEMRTAMQMESLGEIPFGTVSRSLKSQGWIAPTR